MHKQLHTNFVKEINDLLAIQIAVCMLFILAFNNYLFVVYDVAWILLSLTTLHNNELKRIAFFFICNIDFKQKKEIYSKTIYRYCLLNY